MSPLSLGLTPARQDGPGGQRRPLCGDLAVVACRLGGGVHLPENVALPTIQGWTLIWLSKASQRDIRSGPVSVSSGVTRSASRIGSGSF